MANRSGAPSWIHLTTTDLRAANDFYSQLFGWRIEFRRNPDSYLRFSIDGKNVAGVDDAMAPDRQPDWTMYVATDDVQAVTARVEGAGGKILVPPREVLEFGRMAVFTDTSGADFAVWQADANPTGEVFNQPNAYAWSELSTREPEACKEFYGHVFGWTATDHQAGRFKFSTFKLNGVPVARMAEMEDEPALDVPNFWLNYVAVTDTDATVVKAEQLGALTAVSPTDVETGRYALFADPQGAFLAVITRNPSFQPE